MYVCMLWILLWLSVYCASLVWTACNSRPSSDVYWSADSAVSYSFTRLIYAVPIVKCMTIGPTGSIQTACVLTNATVTARTPGWLSDLRQYYNSALASNSIATFISTKYTVPRSNNIVTWNTARSPSGMHGCIYWSTKLIDTVPGYLDGRLLTGR